MKDTSITGLLFVGAYRQWGLSPRLESEFLVIQLNLPKQLRDEQREMTGPSSGDLKWSWVM